MGINYTSTSSKLFSCYLCGCAGKRKAKIRPSSEYVCKNSIKTNSLWVKIVPTWNAIRLCCCDCCSDMNSVDKQKDLKSKRQNHTMFPRLL